MRPAGNADRPSVKNKAMAKIIGFLGIKKKAKLRFAFCRIFGVSKSQQICYANAVSIANYRRLTVNIAYNKI